MVAGVVGHYRFVEFWSQKAWVFSQNAWVFSPEPLSFFQSTGILKIWSQIFEKMAVFCRKFAQKVPNIAFFRRASRKCARFWLIYSKNAENGMSFEIHLATITTGSLSFGLKNTRVFRKVEFFGLDFFSKMLKKACSTYTLLLPHCITSFGRYRRWSLFGFWMTGPMVFRQPQMVISALYR